MLILRNGIAALSILRVKGHTIACNRSDGEYDSAAGDEDKIVQILTSIAPRSQYPQTGLCFQC